MTDIADHYDIYYADKLWNTMPAVYRARDSDDFGANGPLREMVNRIGAQAAILRRAIDRMWNDQSIETCDDWLIPYIGALLDTNLVGGLDTRGQRLDVAKTIYYRRRKGTVAILEEIAADITGWDAKVVEFFRRLGRTRHDLDPPIGLATDSPDARTLQLAAGLVGPLTGTVIGGLADLRNVYGASKAHSAFDEFFHTADMRQGQGKSGWYAIPRLGIFLWRLISLPVGPVTPVAVAGCPGWFTFDPTGRDIPLFGQARASNQFGDSWTSPTEAQLPTPVSQPLLDADLASPPSILYPAALAVQQFLASPPDLNVLPPSALAIRPARGRFRVTVGTPLNEIVASYCYGFPSEIGAGPYDRRLGALTIPTPDPVAANAGGATAPITLLGTGTVVCADSFTYAGFTGVTVTGGLTLQAGPRQRPMIRMNGGAVVLTGSAGSALTLDGIFLSGGDIVLRGTFDSVTLSCCTLDPGSAAAGGGSGSPFAHAADGRPLVPTRIWIEGSVGLFTADRSTLGPIRARAGGVIETVCISNSIVQAIATSVATAIDTADVKDPALLEQRLQQGVDPVSAKLRALASGIGILLGGASAPPFSEPAPPIGDLEPLLVLINRLISGPSIWDPIAFAGVPLSGRTRALLADPGTTADALNRALLDDAFRLELADLALGFADGTVCLSRCTVLGQIAVHRLDASECILQQIAQANDTQGGCVRFTAWADGGVIPRKYESVRIADGAPIFTTTDFGQPGFGQLLPLCDDAILPTTTPTGDGQNTISQGAADGSEMGAYARDKNPIKARALAIKLQEYMPAGLIAVPVNIT